MPELEMIPPDLDLAERRALASPRDWPEDFDKPHDWAYCSDCMKPFLGAVYRPLCRICANRTTL